MARKRSPFNHPVPNRGAVVAVQLQSGLWCYVREYVLCHGFLPFFSPTPLAAEDLPTLRANLYFDLWSNDSDQTPMVLVGTFPFHTEEESFGESYYTAPDALDSCYRIHEVVSGSYRMRKTRAEEDVSGIRLQRRYQSPEFADLLRGRSVDWPMVHAAGTGTIQGEQAMGGNGRSAPSLNPESGAAVPPH